MLASIIKTSSKDILNAKIKLENSLSVITSWFKASGLKVNESKTEICLFSRGHVVPIKISLNGETISTKSTINSWVHRSQWPSPRPLVQDQVQTLVLIINLLPN